MTDSANEQSGAEDNDCGRSDSDLASPEFTEDFGTYPREPEEVHLFARIPLSTERLRDRVQSLFEPKRSEDMAPGYRPNNQSRRANRSYIDHDVFEGLPVRNWRRETVTVAPPPVHDVSTHKDKWDAELPWAMPKDSNLLPQFSQDLLRAARTGRLYVRRQNPEEEEIDTEATLGDKTEKKEEDPKEKGFTVKTWKPVPKTWEGPEIEYLAKRRKGLTGSIFKNSLISGSTMTKARLRHTGSLYIDDVVLTEQQALEGELISQTVLSNSVPGGVATTGEAMQPIPSRRRPPPPKRRAKGPGRGRKRKLPVAPTSVPNDLGSVKVETQTEGVPIEDGAIGPDGIKLENSASVSNGNENEDTEMADDTILPSDEEGEEGSEEEDQDHSEVGDQEDDDGDARLEIPGFPRKKINGSNEPIDDHMNIQERSRDASSSPDLPLANFVSGQVHDHASAGSPLKNVVTFAPPMYEGHSPDLSSEGEAETEGDLDEALHDNIHESMQMQDDGEDSEMREGFLMHQQSTLDMDHEHPHSYGHDFSAGNDMNVMSMDPTSHYADDDDDEMLLHGDVSGMDFELAPPEQQPYPDPLPDEEIMSIPVPDHMSHLDHQVQDQMPLLSEEHAPGAEALLAAHEGGQEEEDTFVDLLGSLEDHLNEQGTGPGHEEVDDGVKPADHVGPHALFDDAAAMETNSSAADSALEPMQAVEEAVEEAVEVVEQVEAVEQVEQVDAVEVAEPVEPVDPVEPEEQAVAKVASEEPLESKVTEAVVVKDVELESIPSDAAETAEAGEV